MSEEAYHCHKCGGIHPDGPCPSRPGSMARPAGLASDAELLDWIERQHLTVTRECELGVCQWRVYRRRNNAYDLEERSLLGFATTLRGAIQSSMPNSPITEGGSEITPQGGPNELL